MTWMYILINFLELYHLVTCNELGLSGKAL